MRRSAGAGSLAGSRLAGSSIWSTKALGRCGSIHTDGGGGKGVAVGAGGSAAVGSGKAAGAAVSNGAAAGGAGDATAGGLAGAGVQEENTRAMHRISKASRRAG
jgi:hypothetical protein